MNSTGHQGTSSNFERMLRSMHWTLENRLLPSVSDDLGRSYLRTLIVMSDLAAKRAGVEWKSLREALDDVHGTLLTLRLLPADAQDPVFETDTAGLEAQVERLEALLAEALDTFDAERLSIYDGYVQRRFERQLRWLPESPGAYAF